MMKSIFVIFKICLILLIFNLLSCKGFNNLKESKLRMEVSKNRNDEILLYIINSSNENYYIIFEKDISKADKESGERFEMYYFFPAIVINNNEIIIKEFPPLIEYIDDDSHKAYIAKERKYINSLNNKIYKLKKKSKVSIILSKDFYNLIKSKSNQNNILSFKLVLIYRNESYDFLNKEIKINMQKEGYIPYYGILSSNEYKIKKND